MTIKKLLAPKKISRIALAGVLGVSLLSAAALIPPPLGTNANAQPVTLNTPQMPGFADVVEAVSPAVVSVRVKADMEMAADFPSHREFRFDRRFMDKYGNMPYFRDDERRGERSKRYSRPDHRGNKSQRSAISQGSGFFVSDDGYIVTNNHVIAKGSEFTVILNDGTELSATLVGGDKRSDLAVLKVDSGQKFTYVEFDDKNPRIGEWVVAVGNPFGLGGTVTAGIVSANGRQIKTNKYDDFIQIDAAVNKGNSGGPTFNLSGKVVGVNTAIFSPTGGNVGIAFAIPAATASEIVDDLISNGKVMRGWLGVQIQPVTSEIAESIGLDDAKGAIVAGAQDASPAKNAGIKPGDVITAVNGTKIKGPRALAKEISNINPDSEVIISLWRDGASKDVTVKLGKLPDEASQGRNNTPRALKSLARIGLELRQSPDGGGVEVIDVVPDSRADKRGIRAGDIIVTINGEEVSDPNQVLEIIRQVRELKRNAALFQIERNGESRFVAIPLRRG
ncbi:MAG: Do family serine endopeptidase [Rhizobiaceae bacterium]|nr:Do family serine endopeptidase [Rhizobiaceae bacterium]